MSTRGFLELTWQELRDLSRDADAAIIPMGQVVQHGPHLPVGTDVFQAQAVCVQTVEALVRLGLPTILGPALAFGHSPAQESYPGYITLRPETLADELEDVAASLSRQGLRKQVVILFGPGSWPSIQVALHRLQRGAVAQMIVIDGLMTARTLARDLLQGPNPSAGEFDFHAGELETSLMLAIAPELVQMDKALRHFSTLHATFAASPCCTGPLQHQMASIGMTDWLRFGGEGVSGDATLATAAKGAQMLSRLGPKIAAHVRTYLFDDATKSGVG